MKTAAIIAEYNPFHNGHAKQIEILREEHGVSHVVSIMSGSYTQRGGPAIFDKRIRAMHAVLGGADAVIELPYVYCGQTAEIFSAGGVGIADMLGVDILCFGCETDETQRFAPVVELLNNETDEFKEVIKSQLDAGISYAVARLNTLEKLTGEDMRFLMEPNNILALEYMRQLERLQSRIKPVPVLRRGAHHHAKEIEDDITSASNIRRRIKEGELDHIFHTLPKRSYQNKSSIESYAIHDIEQYKDIIKAMILLKSGDELSLICDMETGLENRMKQAANELNCGVESFIAKIATKRYTKSRVRRILMNMLMNYTKEDMLIYKHSLPGYARILAANDEGRKYVKSVKKTSDLRLVSNVSKVFHTFSQQDKRIAETEAKAYDLYRLFDSESVKDMQIKPVMLEDDN